MINALLLKKQELAKRKKNGFTLVELIVVLVILAILLAILVPSLTSWISSAKEKQILLNARTTYLAAQTLVDQDYAKNSDWTYLEVNATSGAISLKEGAGATLGAAALEYGGVTAEGATATVTDVNDKGEVVAMTYSEGGKTATLASGTWTVTTGGSTTGGDSSSNSGG